MPLYKVNLKEKPYNNSMQNDLKDRTKQFALRIINLVESLPHGLAAQIVGKQLIRCGTAVAANYRAACRARSQAEFIAKLGIVIEEADEACFWLEIIMAKNMLKATLVKPLLQESNEITAIMVASVNSTKKGKKA